MTWDEATDNFEFNFFGILSVLGTFALSLFNGTLLNISQHINLPEMNFNDIITIVLSILSGIFVIVKISNGVLTFISKRRNMREEKFFQDKFKKHNSKNK